MERAFTLTDSPKLQRQRRQSILCALCGTRELRSGPQCRAPRCILSYARRRTRRLLLLRPRFSPSFFLHSYLLYPGLSSKLRRCQTSLGGVRPRPGPAVRTGAAQDWQGRDCHIFCQPRPMPNQRRHLFLHLFSTGAYSKPKSSPFFEHVFGFGFRRFFFFIS